MITYNRPAPTERLSQNEPRMSISDQDVRRVAKLAKLALTDVDAAPIHNELNDMLALIAQLQAVDTQGVEPLAHPLSVIEDISLRLREDEATAPADIARREHLMHNAPARHEGLFLVPAVIE